MENIFRQERRKQRKQTKAGEAARMNQERREAKKRKQQEEARKYEKERETLPPTSSSMGRDHTLRLLGLTAIQDSPEQIRKAYRKCALMYHPDKNHTKDTVAQFRAIQEAYESLLA